MTTMKTTDTTRGGRPLGAIAKKIDPEGLLALARELVRTQHPSRNPDYLSAVLAPYMLLPVNRGEAAVICSSGIGTIADEDGNVGVYFADGNEGTVLITIPLADISQLDTGATTDIAYGVASWAPSFDASHREWFDRYDSSQ